MRFYAVPPNNKLDGAARTHAVMKICLTQKADVLTESRIAVIYSCCKRE